MNIIGTFTKIRPFSVLQHLASSHDTTCIQVLSNSISWLIFLENGKLTYATHTVEPFDRLERHLRRLRSQLPELDSNIRMDMRMMFESEVESLPIPSPTFPPSIHDATNDDFPRLSTQPSEYQAICWLVSERHLNPTQAALLIQELVKEVLESFLLIGVGKYKFINTTDKLPIICRIDTDKIIGICQKKIEVWQSLTPRISSPYQRPYLRVPELNKPQESPRINQNLAVWMKGFSLRHLAVITSQEEMQMVRNLLPYIHSGEIVLHEPDPPFDLLPRFHREQVISSLTDGEKIQASPAIATVTEVKSTSNLISYPVRSLLQDTQTSPLHQPVTIEKPPVPQPIPTSTTNPPANQFKPPAPVNLPPDDIPAKKTYKIVSVDDSPTVLREISRFLEQENFAVVAINDPVKAVMSIIRNKPDLILLDLNMDGIDGYELCRIIRNNSMFKKTPIIMVTGNKGLIDKVKARFVGASGYLTKPFTRAELLKMVFMHLA